MASEGCSLPIEDYALIGDCRSAALVGRDGSIDWLCWPHFDSDACFAALLGADAHGRWRLAPADAQVVCTRRYQGDTLVLETVFRTSEGEVALVDFMPLEPAQPAIVRRVEGRRGRVSMRLWLALRFEYGSIVPWVTHLADGDGIEAVAGPNRVILRSDVEVHGEGEATTADFAVAAGEVRTFVLGWSPSHEDAPVPFDPEAELENTLSFWSEWASRCTYHGPARDAVVRSMLTLKALSYTRTGAIVAAPTTSLPELVGGGRNWDYRFSWLRDATLTLLTFIACGYPDEAEAWGAWLRRAVAGVPADVQIMYGLHGERRIAEWTVDWLPGYDGAAPVRVGNAAAGQVQLDTYGEVAIALHQARRADLPVPSSAWRLQRALIEHLLEVWEQPDDGMWEMRGGARHFTHSKIMAWVALDRTIADVEAHGFEAPLDTWRAVRARMHAQICERAYDPVRNTFTQSFDAPALDANLLLIPRVGFLPANDRRVIGTVDAVERELLADGLLRRYRTESGDDGLQGGEGAFLPCSFWLVSAYRQIGRTDEADALFARLLSLRNDVGLLAEEYDPKARRQLGNFPQAYSHLALVHSVLDLSLANPIKP